MKLKNTKKIMGGLFSNHKYLHRIRCLSITKDFWPGYKSCLYKYFSSFDLKSAYNQIRLKQSDRKYTAFEANGQLFEFTRLPFGVTNGVPTFQCAMNEIVREENLTDTFPYLDNIIIGGETKKQHGKFHEGSEEKMLDLEWF